MGRATAIAEPASAPRRTSAKTLGGLGVVGLVAAFSLSSTLVKRAESPGVLVAFWRMIAVSVLWDLVLWSTARRVTRADVRQVWLPGMLIACRAVMGAGAAFIMPATLSLLISVFPDERERATAVGIWAATAGLGVALGPVAGGFLLDHFSWGSIFIVNVPLCALAIVLGAASSPMRATRPTDGSTGPARRRRAPA